MITGIRVHDHLGVGEALHAVEFRTDEVPRLIIMREEVSHQRPQLRLL